MHVKNNCFFEIIAVPTDGFSCGNNTDHLMSFEGIIIIFGSPIWVKIIEIPICVFLWWRVYNLSCMFHIWKWFKKVKMWYFSPFGLKEYGWTKLQHTQMKRYFILSILLCCSVWVIRVANSFQFARIKFNRNWVSLYTIQWRKLILITECYENRRENRFSISRRICRPGDVCLENSIRWEHNMLLTHTSFSWIFQNLAEITNLSLIMIMKFL